jgi:hypothetical protein
MSHLSTIQFQTAQRIRNGGRSTAAKKVVTHQVLRPLGSKVEVLQALSPHRVTDKSPRPKTRPIILITVAVATNSDFVFGMLIMAAGLRLRRFNFVRILVSVKPS